MRFAHLSLALMAFVVMAAGIPRAARAGLVSGNVECDLCANLQPGDVLWLYDLQASYVKKVTIEKNDEGPMHYQVWLEPGIYVASYYGLYYSAILSHQEPIRQNIYLREQLPDDSKFDFAAGDLVPPDDDQDPEASAGCSIAPVGGAATCLSSLLAVVVLGAALRLGRRGRRSARVGSAATGTGTVTVS